MATRRKQFPRTRGNWGPLTLSEAATQSFVAGDLLQINTDGQVSIVAAAGNDFDSTSSKRFGGIAMQNASGVTNRDIQVLVPMDDSAQMCLPVEHGTPASAVTNRNLVGDAYVLTNISAAEGYGVAIDTTTNPTLRVVEVDPTFPFGELNGDVWVAPIVAYTRS